MQDPLTFYGIILGALLTAESVLLSLFGGLFGVYARYMTTKDFDDAPVVSSIRRINIYTCMLLGIVIIGVWVTIAATLCALQTPNPIQILSLLLVGIISVLIIAPAVRITAAMRPE